MVLMKLEENYNRVKEVIEKAEVRTGRKPGSVRLIAVTKTVNAAVVRQAVDLGITDFGENRVQDAVKKVTAFRGVRWHFIGHLQSNKVKDVLPYYSMIHSLDRVSLANEIQRVAEKMDMVADVLIQVNVSGEVSKFGLDPGNLAGFLIKMRSFDRIKIHGLMTMAPFESDPESTRPHFRALKELRDINARPGVELKELSMGMTNDYTVAVEEGATMVRIGSALFK